jgi:hypothetical protein
MADLPVVPALPAQRLCVSDELPERGRAIVFDVLHYREPARAFALRFDGRVVAYLNRCVHVPTELDWQMLARPRQTVVIYMGVGALAIICEQLIRHGMSAETPAAVVEQATRREQRTITGSLRTLPTLALVHGVQPPAVIMIGAVVALHRRLGSPAVDPRRQFSEDECSGVALAR